MSVIGRHVSALRRAVRNEHGSIAVTMALTFSVVLISAGAAVDYERWLQAKQSTIAAIDAAVLAGGLALQLDSQNAAGAILAAQKTYAANIERRLTVMSDTVNFAVGTDNAAVTASGTAKISTTILNLFGITSLPLLSDSGMELARAEVTTGGPGGSNLEVAAMLDVTGSMCDDGAGPCTSGVKFNALKAATTKLVNIVVRPDQSVHTTKVAFVPFSTRVRVAPDGTGANLMKALTNLDSPLSYWYVDCPNATGGGGSETGLPWSCGVPVTAQATNWQVMPCVTERFINAGSVFDVTDDAPGPGKWLNGHDGTRWPVSQDSTTTPFTSGVGAVSSDPADQWNFSPNAGDCADIYAGSEIVPLTSDKSELTAHIGTLQAFGGTAGALATSWTWYMLSPNWSGIWTGSGAPAPYSDLTARNSDGAPKLRKVAIMETDGGFNVLHSWKGQSQQQISDYAISVCNAMKARGIEIYTVGFMLNTLPASEAAIARATLAACGSDVQHFYDSLTTNDLETAFNQIGVKLTGVRLTR